MTIVKHTDFTLWFAGERVGLSPLPPTLTAGEFILVPMLIFIGSPWAS